MGTPSSARHGGVSAVSSTKPTKAGTRTGYATAEMGFSWVWASKPGQSPRGWTDGTWQHRGGRVEAKLPMRRRGGRRIQKTAELDHNALRAGWLALCI